MHYDIVSAFIKSIRGSDPDGALYWLARMVEGGEDPAFIARRLVISASEDIGLANPNALLLANAAFDAVMKIGWPEGRIPLAEATGVSGYQSEKQFRLMKESIRHWSWYGRRETSGSATFAQCTYQAYEAIGIWKGL